VRKTAFFSGEQWIVLSELGHRDAVMGTIMMVLDATTLNPADLVR